MIQGPAIFAQSNNGVTRSCKLLTQLATDKTGCTADQVFHDIESLL